MAVELLKLKFCSLYFSMVGKLFTIQSKTATIIFVRAEILCLMHNEVTEQGNKVSGHCIEPGSLRWRNQPRAAQFGQ